MYSLLAVWLICCYNRQLCASVYVYVCVCVKTDNN